VRIRVRLFAIQRELVGTRELALELPSGASIDDAWGVLVERHPVLAPGRSSVRFARNASYVAASTALEDGDELAIIPPVSGGAADPAHPAADPAGAGGRAEAGAGAPDVPVRRRIIELREGPLEHAMLGELADRLAIPADGAVVGFLGVTRDSPGTPAPGQEAEAARHAGRRVEALDYEAHDAMARAVIEAIADEIEVRFGVTRIGLVHRVGEVPLGQASVAIVACAPHRDAAFQAARYAIDETKGRAPIWKAERFEDGHVWIGEPARSGPADD
jgi:molybdopterin synthase catalytic subunit